jgi:hypothetical protein
MGHVEEFRPRTLILQVSLERIPCRAYAAPWQVWVVVQFHIDVPLFCHSDEDPERVEGDKEESAVCLQLCGAIQEQQIPRAKNALRNDIEAKDIYSNCTNTQVWGPSTS